MLFPFQSSHPGVPPDCLGSLSRKEVFAPVSASRHPSRSSAALCIFDSRSVGVWGCICDSLPCMQGVNGGAWGLVDCPEIRRHI